MPRIHAAWSLLFLLLFARPGLAEVRLAPAFGDSMVVQRDQPVHVWGWTRPDIEVQVTLADHEASTRSSRTGRFDVELEPLPAGGPHELVVRGDETRTLRDVLVGEVWLCAGESNMAWPVSNAKDGDIELLTARYPDIRLLSIPLAGARLPQEHFDARWSACTPETVKSYSAVAYFFGRQLHESLDVPIGLIDASFAGTTIEAWIPRDELERAGAFEELLAEWDARDATLGRPAPETVDPWEDAFADWDELRSRPRSVRNRPVGPRRPADVYNGVVHPLVGTALRGVAWYQGESNVERAYQYRELFPLWIQSWRRAWGRADMPFYWVQLAGFQSSRDTPAGSPWAELREAQTRTAASVPHTGQVVAIDVGHPTDLHPRDKQTVARRLARWALTRTYGFSNPLCPQGAVTHRSPIFASMAVEGTKAIVRLEHPNGGLSVSGGQEPKGFTIAGADRVFVPARARITDRWGTLEVWSDAVARPVAVRYAWADDPEGNLYGGLPVTPFRTDDWPGVTEGRVR